MRTDKRLSYVNVADKEECAAMLRAATKDPGGTRCAYAVQSLQF
jgi:hypothetical protein